MYLYVYSTLPTPASLPTSTKHELLDADRVLRIGKLTSHEYARCSFDVTGAYRSTGGTRRSRIPGISERKKRLVVVVVVVGGRRFY